MEALEEFGNRLYDARMILDMTQAEVGERAGLDAAHVAHFESGRRKPSMRNLIALADAVNVSTDWLLGRVNNPDEKLQPRIFRDLKEFVDVLQERYG